MRHITRILLTVAFMVLIPQLIPCVHAQTDMMLTQYWAVPTYYNPAATGDSDYLRIRGAGKLQWLGIRNAPKGFALLADAPLQIGKQRIGLGIDAQYEQLGLFKNTDFAIQASYKIKLFKGVLSIGLEGGYFMQTFQGTKVDLPDNDDYHQSGDEAIPNQDLTGNTFDFSAGVQYTHKWFYVGVGGKHLLQPRIKMSVEGSESTETHEFESEVSRMLYFNAGSNIPIKNTLFELQPSLLLKSDFNTFGGEIDFRATYNKFITFGAGYRWKEAVSVMVGATFKNIYVGYAYDYPLSAISKASSGSHEVVVGYQMKLDFSQKNKNKHRSIRFM